MSKTIITRKEIRVPVGALLEVADLLLENNLSNSIVGADGDADEITLEVEYTKDDKDTINRIKYMIEDFEAGEDDENE